MGERVAVVVPTNRPDRMAEFVAAWDFILDPDRVDLLIVFDMPSVPAPYATWNAAAWEDIDAALKDMAWVIARRSPAVRSFGIWWALRSGYDIIITMDDDVRPDPSAPDFVAQHVAALRRMALLDVVNPHPHVRVRGLPYEMSPVPVAVNLGLWQGVPDVDAETQLAHGVGPWPQIEWCPYSRVVARGQFLPVCSMNLAFTADIAPAYYFPNTGPTMRRWNDIWAGIFAKMVADAHGLAFTYGPPLVRHERASDPIASLEDEAYGMALNEDIWRFARRLLARSSTPLLTYEAIAGALGEWVPDARPLSRAMLGWARLMREG